MRYLIIATLIVISMLLAGCYKYDPHPYFPDTPGSVNMTDVKFSKLRQSATLYANSNELIAGSWGENQLRFYNEVIQPIPSDSLAFKAKITDKVARGIVYGCYMTFTMAGRYVYIDDYLQFPFDVCNSFVDTSGSQRRITGQLVSSYSPMDARLR